MSVINFWVDAGLLVLLVLLGWESAMLQIVFPAPTLAAGWTLWALTFDQWRDIQFATLCSLAFAVLVHLMLHWNWICSVIATQIVQTRSRPDEGMQTIYGVATLLAVLHIIAAGVILGARLRASAPGMIGLRLIMDLMFDWPPRPGSSAAIGSLSTQRLKVEGVGSTCLLPLTRRR